MASKRVLDRIAVKNSSLRNRKKCPMTYVTHAIGGKWKANILYIVFEHQVILLITDGEGC